MTEPNTAPHGWRHALRALARSWVELTREEQQAVVLILGLLILGILVRYWHLVR